MSCEIVKELGMSDFLAGAIGLFGVLRQLIEYMRAFSNCRLRGFLAIRSRVLFRHAAQPIDQPLAR